MSKKYCFRIIKSNPDEIFDVEKLKEFVRDLYIKKGEFDSADYPFVTFYVNVAESACIQLTSTSGKVSAKIDEINEKLSAKDLRWTKSISLEFYKFNDKQILDLGSTKGRWDSIIQNGPYFSEIVEPYKFLGASLSVIGKSNSVYKLNPIEEKIASFYAKRKIAEEKDSITIFYTKPKNREKPAEKEMRGIFNKNFWTDFQTYLSPAAKKKITSLQDFLNIDWSDLIEKIKQNTIDTKKLSKAEKQSIKVKNLEKLGKYGYITLNGFPFQKVGNYNVEASGIFLGRGKNKRLGKIKKQILPEDVTINIGAGDPKPEAPSEYDPVTKKWKKHKWGNVVNLHNAAWIAKWKENISDQIKYVFLSAEGAFKAESDTIKYEKARKLHKHIDTVREKYMKDAEEKDRSKMELGTVLYLIDYFGIRVGNEKDKDDAETVGASTLLVKNVILNPPNKVKFNFLGKDSIEYDHEHVVPKIIYNNFVKLMKGRKPDDQIFQIASENINNYLKQFDKSFSAKVFRTRLASEIMYKALSDLTIPEGTSNIEIKRKFVNKNKEVAEVLNHTRTATVKAQDDLKKLEADLDQAKANKDEKKIKKLTDVISAKKDVLSVAVNTSLTNYIDPRLVVSWANNQEINPLIVYTAVLARKFSWAIEGTEEGWEWDGSPLEEENEELEPQDDEEITRSRRRRSVKKDLDKIKTKPPKPPADKPISIKPPPKAPADKPISIKPPPKAPANKPISIKPPPKPPADKPISIKPPPKLESMFLKSIPRVGSIADYEILLKICKNLDKNRNANISKVERKVLDWLYPLCKVAIMRGANVEINKFIIKYYEDTMFDLDLDLSPPTPIDQDPSPDPSPAPPSTPIIKKDLIIKKENIRFTFLNLYKNETDLRKYCKKYSIDIKGKKDKKEIKEAIMEFYKDTPIDLIYIS
jgi:DNA topoisomerase IB